jgi:hypothetical protein
MVVFAAHIDISNTICQSSYILICVAMIQYPCEAHNRTLVSRVNIPITVVASSCVLYPRFPPTPSIITSHYEW